MKKPIEFLILIFWTAVFFAVVFFSVLEYEKKRQVKKYDPSENWYYLEDPPAE